MDWVAITLLIPFCTALACMLAVNQPLLARSLGVGGAALLLIASGFLLHEVYHEGFAGLRAGSWPAPFGIMLVADMLSACMVVITAIIGLTVAIYSLRDIETALVRSHYFALFHLLLMGVIGAFLTSDLFNLYVWFEVMLITSFVLITLGGSKAQLEGGVKYLVLNLVSSILFLSGVGLLYGKLGTLNMADIAQVLASSEGSVLVNSSGLLLLASFCIKAALFPFFFWLPASYHTPRVAISAVFAGLLTKVGVYALIRYCTLIFHNEFELIQGIMVFLAAATMVTGVLGAAAQFEIRKILSFHIVSQIGYMVMGIAIATPLALTGAVFYTLHHIIVKTNLFLIGGLVLRQCGSMDLKYTGGLYRTAPLLALLFFIPAFSLGGIPPLSGFWAKFTVVKAGLDAGHYWLVATALLVGILTLYSMTKIWAEAFWKEQTDTDPKASRFTGPMTWSLVVPCVILAAMTLLIGFYSQPLFHLSEIASEQLMNPQAYIDYILNPEGTDHATAP